VLKAALLSEAIEVDAAAVEASVESFIAAMKTLVSKPEDTKVLFIITIIIILLVCLET